MSPRRSYADDLLDELLPDELDWRPWVVDYPKSALLVATLGGLIVGYNRGRAITAALTGLAADTITESANQFVARRTP